MTPSSASMAARAAVLIAGVVVLLAVPWDTPFRAGRIGCLAVGVRAWVVGLALLLAALQWFRSGKTARGI